MDILSVQEVVDEFNRYSFRLRKLSVWLNCQQHFSLQIPEGAVLVKMGMHIHRTPFVLSEIHSMTYFRHTPDLSKAVLETIESMWLRIWRHSFKESIRYNNALVYSKVNANAG